ncbi:MAG: hypothetical protein NUV61_00095 [Candidatus Azambacteria bacterium]|nr:hypothetical protein [Candidatus Azambacteria bacterium]
MEMQSVTRQNTTSMFVLFFRWLFIESTMHVARTWLFYIDFGLRVFSVPLLVRTFFSPWHRYSYGHPKTFDPAQLFAALFGNLMSRGIGMILRTFFIALGLVLEVFIVLIGFVFLVGWMLLPIASFYFFYLGMKLFLF